MSGLRRVIVGASGSPGNLCALRYAEHLARATSATLIPVHAWIPPGGDVADRRCPSFYLRRVWTEDARRRLREALEASWGQTPAYLDIKPRVERGEPGAVLTSIANQTGDILVIGTGRRGTLTHLFSGRVSRYCLAHAHVPLVAIPPPTLASHLRHSPLRWMFWHRPLKPDGVLHDRGKTAALTPPDRRGLVPMCDGRWQTRDRGDHGPGAEGPCCAGASRWSKRRWPGTWPGQPDAASYSNHRPDRSIRHPGKVHGPPVTKGRSRRTIWICETLQVIPMKTRRSGGSKYNCPGGTGGARTPQAPSPARDGGNRLP